MQTTHITAWRAAIKTILTAGLLAGILDGADAVIYFAWFRKAGVAVLFQFIASGLLGESSFRLGWVTVALGVVLQLFIATGAAVVFYIIALVQPVVLRKPFLSGPLFGLAVFFIMHYIVVPLSRVPDRSSTSPLDYLSLVAAHIFFVGLPIAIVTARASGLNVYSGSADRAPVARPRRSTN